jgi:hypothetical protein
MFSHIGRLFPPSSSRGTAVPRFEAHAWSKPTCGVRRSRIAPSDEIPVDVYRRLLLAIGTSIARTFFIRHMRLLDGHNSVPLRTTLATLK